MGVVYLGESPTGALAAVKVIRPDMLEIDEFRRRFVREVQLARSVTGSFTAQLLLLRSLNLGSGCSAQR